MSTKSEMERINCKLGNFKYAINRQRAANQVFTSKPFSVKRPERDSKQKSRGAYSNMKRKITKTVLILCIMVQI